MKEETLALEQNNTFASGTTSFSEGCCGITPQKRTQMDHLLA